MLAGITLFLDVVLALVMLAARAGRHTGQPTTEDWMLGFAMLGSMCGGGVLGAAGVILGIIGVAIPNRRKRVAVIGLVANACLLLAIFLIMAVSD